MEITPDLTALIKDWQEGDAAALDKLTPFVYSELKRLARRQMAGENSNHTLQVTALVNEAFIKLAGTEVDFENQAHFLNAAARIMRHILVDHARSKQRVKRGSGVRDLTFDEAAIVTEDALPAIVELDAALDKLVSVDKKLAQTVELIFFGGLTYEETAKQLGVSRTTVYDDLQFSKAWLKKELS